MNPELVILLKVVGTLLALFMALGAYSGMINSNSRKHISASKMLGMFALAGGAFLVIFWAIWQR